MSLCTHCGKEIEDLWSCPFCGALNDALTSGAPAGSPGSAVPPAPAAGSKEPEVQQIEEGQGPAISGIHLTPSVRRSAVRFGLAVLASVGLLGLGVAGVALGIDGVWYMVALLFIFLCLPFIILTYLDFAGKVRAAGPSGVLAWIVALPVEMLGVITICVGIVGVGGSVFLFLHHPGLHSLSGAFRAFLFGLVFIMIGWRWVRGSTSR